MKQVVVFGVTGAPNIPASVTQSQVDDIAYALAHVDLEGPRIGLTVVGRGSEEARSLFEQAFEQTGMDLNVLGLQPVEVIARELQRADALLFVRGHVSTRRTTAIAGIASGTPIVGYRGPETDFPITKAGIVLVEDNDREGLVIGLNRLLTDHDYWTDMHQRNLAIHEQYFSWHVIAERYMIIINACSASCI